jgi:taurine--2-oxoglutarate transaminase
LYDGPESVAAIFLEPVSGTSGGYSPPAQFVRGVRELCDEYGILLVFDETLCAWGRCGQWFVSNGLDVVPDVITTAKGLTSGYVPLGAVIASKTIYEQFLEKPFVGGLTYEGHALACAAGVANLEIYRNERLPERAEELGRYLKQQLLAIAPRHRSVGDVRCQGLFACVELTSQRDKKEPLAGYRDRRRNISAEITRRLRSMDLIVLAKWDFIFLGPPLVVSREEIDDCVSKLDDLLAFTDALCPE